MNFLTREEIFKLARSHASPSGARESWAAGVGKVLFEASSKFFKSKNVKLNKDLFFNSTYVSSDRIII